MPAIIVGGEVPKGVRRAAGMILVAVPGVHLLAFSTALGKVLVQQQLTIPEGHDNVILGGAVRAELIMPWHWYLQFIGRPGTVADALIADLKVLWKAARREVLGGDTPPASPIVAIEPTPASEACAERTEQPYSTRKTAPSSKRSLELSELVARTPGELLAVLSLCVECSGLTRQQLAEAAKIPLSTLYTLAPKPARLPKPGEKAHLPTNALQIVDLLTAAGLPADQIGFITTQWSTLHARRYDKPKTTVPAGPADESVCDREVTAVPMFAVRRGVPAVDLFTDADEQRRIIDAFHKANRAARRARKRLSALLQTTPPRPPRRRIPRRTPRPRSPRSRCARQYRAMCAVVMLAAAAATGLLLVACFTAGSVPAIAGAAGTALICFLFFVGAVVALINEPGKPLHRQHGAELPTIPQQRRNLGPPGDPR